MEKRIFMFESNGDYEQHGVYKLDGKEATKLVSDEKATEIELGEYENYRKRAEKLTKAFKKAEKKVKESDNPLHTKDFKDYELAKMKEEYVSDSKALKAEYNEYRDKAIEEARQKSAQARIIVTESDKQMAEQLANRLALEAQVAVSDRDKAELVDKAKENIGRLTDEQKTAMQGSIGKVLSYLDDRKKRELIQKVRDIRNMDLLAEKAAEQLPLSPTLEYDRIRLVRRWD
ncbi:hypothetical protein [Halobacillus mangrovi]|uniref:Uncharacterized protein n=1 Tax=Halobacillus mangrovi TaxID=402384 RepID=A0A1W5ZYB3_9BACI|nr:hypothetical protein [Halobacillus mangrovi]ARI78231.1 hypothetical protein HM131_15840 [Halobacillus mangrovi]